jgi:hypothetical protein
VEIQKSRGGCRGIVKQICLPLLPMTMSTDALQQVTLFKPQKVLLAGNRWCRSANEPRLAQGIHPEVDSH